MRKNITYPFVPKSAASLKPGQFWAIPLSGGRYGCGRVIQTDGEELPTSRAFFGGLHDWIGAAPPTVDTIAGRSLLDSGVMHIKAILQTGGQILGCRPLEADELVPPLLLSSRGGIGTMVLRGAQRLRTARQEEWGTYPVLGVWGYDFIRQRAEHLFGSPSGDAA